MPACFWLPSTLLVRLQTLLAVLAALAVAGSSLPVVARAGLGSFCLGWACWRLIHHHSRRGPQQRSGLRHGATAGWELWRADSGWRPIEILAGTLVTRRLVVVRYRHAGRRWVRSLVVPAHALSADCHRRLRLWLRFSPVSGAAVK